MDNFYMAPRDVENEKNCYFRAVRILNSERPATIDIAVESYYILYINGKVIGRGPARGTRRHNYFDSYEISEYLYPGKNVIALLICCMNIPTYIAVPAQPAFWIRLDGTSQVPADWHVFLASDWRKDTPIYTAQTGFAEWRDMRMEPIGWMSGKGVSDWPAAVKIPADSAIYLKKLLPRGIPPLQETVLPPVDIPVKASVKRVDNLDVPEIAKLLMEEEHFAIEQKRMDGFNEWMCGNRTDFVLQPGPDGEGIALVFDFGAEIIGRFELEIAGRDDAVVDICYEEELWNNRLKAVAHSYNFADRYALRDGRQIIGNTISERGFRMVQIVVRNFKEPMTVRSVRAIKAVYPYIKRSSFTCDDFMLNKIWEACGETLSTCTTDIFIDCPWRERAFWVCDLMVENMTSLEFFGASSIHQRALRMIFSDARDNGLVPGVCPYPEVHDRNILPATNLYMPLIMRDYLLHSGDLNLIRELLPEVFKIFDAVEAWSDNEGLITAPENVWNLIDWSFSMTGVSLEGKNTALLNYLYVTAIETALDLAVLAGVSVDEAKYRTRAAQTAESADRRFFKPGENRLADCLETDGKPSEHSSQLTHAIALLSGQVPDVRRKSYEAALNDNKILTPELYLSYFAFRAMRLCGQETVVLERIRKYWGAIVESGSPTIWEAGVHQKGKKAFNNAGSLCHGFATAPVDFIQTVILGVEPLTPGFTKFRISPKACGLKFAQGRIPTPHGNIHVRWDSNGTGLQVKLDVPPDTIAVCDDKRFFAAGLHEFTL